MSFLDEYRKALKKEQEEQKQEVAKKSAAKKESPFLTSYRKNLAVMPKADVSDIAPVTPTVTTTKKDKDERTLFQKGLFEDGYQRWDISKTILGTTTDVLENVGSGIMGMGESALDALAYLGIANAKYQYYAKVGGISPKLDKLFEEQHKKATKATEKFIKKDLYDEEAVAKAIISDPVKALTGVDAEKASVFGEKADSLVQSGGQFLATAGLQAAGVPWFLTMGATSFGSEVENALNQGATYAEAGLSATISAGAEILTEKLSGGIKFGGKTLDDAILKPFIRGISDKTGRLLVNAGIDAVGEGAEEIVSGVFSAIGQKLSYMDDKELGELFTKEDAAEAFLGGFILGGVGNVVQGVKANKNGVDAVTGLTFDEQAVVDKVFRDRVAEAEENGTVSKKEKDKIYEQVINDLDKGYLSTEDIEGTLSGDAYKSWQQHTDTENQLQKEIDTLENMPNAEITVKQSERLKHLREALADHQKKYDTKNFKTILSEKTMGRVKDTRLAASYEERARRGQVFEADLSRYDEKQQAVIQKAIDSGILNNTNRTHEFVDTIAKISADKGVLFDFTNNEKLKESGFAVEGKSVNGYATKDGITLNIDSPKAWQSTVGHEITHVLEGTEMYDALKATVFEYAKSKGDYQSRYDALAKLYDGVGADIEAELTADLVGDYLFQDADFIRNLSTQNRNVFQKIYDEIKYLYKVVTAGSKEARELEKVKRAFDKAYRESAKEQSETKYSMSEGEYAPTFYSHMARVVVDSKQQKFGAASVVSFLRGKGVKADEIKWSGIEEWLAGKKSVTKAELQEFINGSQLQIEEQQKGGRPDYTEAERKKLEQTENELFDLTDRVADAWQLVYGTEMPLEVMADGVSLYYSIKRAIRRAKPHPEYRNIVEDSDRYEEYKKAFSELQRTLASIDEVEQVRNEIVERAEERNKPQWEEYKLGGGENYREILFKMPGSQYSNAAMEAHWGRKNRGVLAHARMQDFDVDGKKMLFIEEIQSDWHNAGARQGYGDLDAEKARINAEYDERLTALAKWQDKLDSYNARTQAGEYLEDYYDVYDEYMSAAARVEASEREIKSMDRGLYRIAPDAPFKRNYHEYVLKRLVRMAAEEGYDSIGWTTANLQSKRWSDEYAEGYRIEYDQDIPKFLNKYGKKWGAQVGKTTVGTGKTDLDGNPSFGGGDYSEEVWSMPITHAMKQSVLYEGQPKYSLSDSDGKELTKEQSEYFKDSKMRDENGNLKVMYHGSQDAGFHVFDARMSDDDTSFFFVDRNDVAASYSGTSEIYEAKTIRSAEDMNKFLAEIGHDDYEVEERDGKFFLYQDDDYVAKSDSAQGIYEEFCWYEGVGDGDANYKVYLNLTNPLVVDAEGRNWDNVSTEFWPELYEQFRNDFTEEEKAALIDLAGWEDFSTFKAEVERAVRDAGKPTADEYTKAIDSAYWKNSDISSLFSMATDNFSDEVLKAEAIKQMTTRDYAQKAKTEGYDGVIFKNIVDIGAYGGDYKNPATVAVAFDSNQIKSVANENPTKDKDIRYSLSDPETDKNYLDAVSIGDTKTAQRMVEEVAGNAMPDSKLRMPDGRLRTVYHGTNTGDFTVFNPDYIGMSSGDDGFFGMGFYFAYSKGEATYYGAKRIIPAYLDLKNPFDFEKELQTYNGKQARSGYAPDAVALMNFADKFPEIAKDITIGVIEKGSEYGDDIPLSEFTKAFKDVIENKKFEYQEDINDYGETETLVLADPEIVEFEYGGQKHSYKEYGFQKRWYGKPNDLDVAYEYLANSVYEYVDMIPRTRLILDNNEAFTAALKQMGYDGAIQSVDGDEAVAFEPSQIKSAEPVTYDDSGKPIPLSERFNRSNPDIRYSLSEEVTDEQNAHGLDAKSEVQFSLSNDSAYMDNAVKVNNSAMRVDSKVLEETKALRERIAARMNAIKDRGLAGLPEDIEGNTYIANSSYDGTEENTTICPRSLASEAFMDAVSEYLGRPLTVNEQIYISQDLQGRSMTPECTYCYVATDRKAYRAFLGEYVAQRDAVLQKVQENPGADVSRSGELYKEFLNGRKDTNPMYSRFKMWVDAYKSGKPMIDASHLANINKLMGDINSEFGAELKPQIVDAMKYAQSASWAKKRVSYVAYNGHILKWKQDRINKLNSHYGLRMYSFSDFHPAFVLENMQMITDASVRGLKMLGYTKDTDFVDIFAPSGMNINVSTFGFESAGNVFENSLIGAEWAKAKALREQYSNVGVTFVATNDTLVNWALDQDWIDVVIPYHLVRTGTEVAKAFNYTNYTSESADTKTKEWVKGDKKYIAPTEHNNDLETYLKALEKNHLKPRFERFIAHPNYMKLVNECRQPASVSKPVQPVFNEDAAMIALAKLEANGYYQPVGGSVDRMYEIAGEVAETMNQELAPKMSLYNIGDGYKRYGSYATPARELRLEKAPAQKASTKETPEVAPTRYALSSELFPDDRMSDQEELEQLYQSKESIEHSIMEAALAEDADALTQASTEYDAVMERIEEIERAETARLESLDEADMPPEVEAPLHIEDAYDDAPADVEDPFADRDWYDANNLTSIMEERPDLKAFFQEEAMVMLGDLNDSDKAQLLYNDELYYSSGGEKGWMGHKRSTSDDIAEILDDWHIGWDALEKGLTNIANGEAKTAVPKKLEFMLNRRLLRGYKDFHTNKQVGPNQDYIYALREAQNLAHYEEERNSFFDYADDYAPPVREEDIAPVAGKNIPNYPSMANGIPGQRTMFETPAKRKSQTAPTEEAPIYESRDKTAVKGQTTMFAPPPPGQRVANVLTEEAAIAKEKSGIGGKLVAALVDKGMVFENLSMETGNQELQAKYNYALPSNTEARAQYLMENGGPGVKSLKDIRKRVQDSGKTKSFYDYLYHVHNIDRMTLEDRFNDTPNKTVFGETITAEVSRKKVSQYEKTNPEFRSMAEDIYRYNRHLRNLMVEGGLISQETADLWQKMYPHYVPIRRVDTKGLNINVPLDTNRTGVNNPVRRATGGSSDIMPLFETMAMRTEQTYRAIARNSFGIELKNTLGTTIEQDQHTAGVDETIDTIEAQEEKLLKPGTVNSNPTFTVFENGERVEFEITEDMYDALKPAGKILGYRNKAVQKLSDARRNLLTVWNPVFALYRNPIKDIQDVAINSQHAAKTYRNVPNAIYQMATGGKYATEYHQSGGKSNTYFDSRSNQFKAEDSVFKRVIGMPVKAIETAGEFIEEIPRLAEYIASREEGRSVERSMLDAARVTTNFAAGGDFTKFLNSHGFTFLNASVQGASQHVRNFREAKKEGLKGYAKVLAKYVIAGLPGVLLNNLLWDDDEEYKELSNYVKQNYYVVAKTGDGKFIRIPKGRTAAVMGELMQQMENLVTGNDVADLAAFNELFWNNIAPNNPIENNILAPVMQVKNNEAWYGGDLVPTRLQDVPAEEQFDESTDSISKWLGEKTGTSPYKWNYLIDQYSGGLGDVFLPMLTPEAESGDNSFMGNLLAPWKKEMSTDSELNNKYPGDFYDLRDELEVKANSSKATEEDAMRSLFMDSVSWDMSALYQQKREIQNSDMSDAEKYEAVREVQEQINALAESAMNGYNDVHISGAYAEVGDRRFNYSEGEGKWYEIQEENSDGTANYYYEKEQKVTQALGISHEEYWNNRDEYNYAYDYPEKYQVARAVGGIESFKSYTSDLWDLKADKDENGKSISGSRKEKVLDYINNLDADYGVKIILFKNEYNADDTYNQDIISYLNGRDDISYEEMATILKYLGFDVDANGNVFW